MRRYMSAKGSPRWRCRRMTCDMPSQFWRGRTGRVWVRRGLAGRGAVGQVLGLARSDAAWHGEVRLGGVWHRRGVVRRGVSRRGLACLGQVRSVVTWSVQAWRGRSRSGVAWQGSVRCGMAGRDLVGFGLARHGTLGSGTVRCGEASPGPARSGLGRAWSGEAWRGAIGPDRAR